MKRAMVRYFSLFSRLTRYLVDIGHFFLIKMSFFTKYRVNLEKRDGSNIFRYFLD